jgi:hypothetical protein
MIAQAAFRIASRDIAMAAHRFRYDSLDAMLRILQFCVLATALGQQGSPDPVFEKVPFDEWLKGGTEARIRWSMRISPARLTVYQRLAVNVSVEVDGAEFLKRSHLVVFLEIRDRDGNRYRNHRALIVGDLKKPSDLASVNFDQFMFINPGEYEVAAAVFDADAKDHSLKRMRLRVPELAHDPLPDAWRDLPSVEMVTLGDPPERWYLPEITSRLHLPVKTERAVRLEVLVNESPTEIAMGRMGRVSRRNMGNLIPALKVISQMEIAKGTMNISLLDLERRKVSFHQQEVGKLDWTRLRAELAENDPNLIDVHALENHEQNAQFFVSEVRKRLESTESNGAGPVRVLIVLSGPMAFSKGQDLHPIEAAPEPGSRVFYIRYYAPVRPQAVTLDTGPELRRGVGMRPPPPAADSRGKTGEDSLVRTLKPLAPRTFDVTTPIEFRSALAAIISEISQLK